MEAHPGRPGAPLIDGELDGSPLRHPDPEVAGTDVEWIDRTDARIAVAGIPEERAAANAWSTFQKALHIGLTGDSTAADDRAAGLGSSPRAAHTVITADAAQPGWSCSTAAERRRSARTSRSSLGADANITVVSLQEWDDEARHLASQFARLGKDSKLKHIIVSLGGGVVRVNPSTHLAEAGLEAELFGVYFADAGQHLEQRVYVHHAAPTRAAGSPTRARCNGEGARTVWVGDVLIGPDAVGTDSLRAEPQPRAERRHRADSIPNLEIETGDILGAGHASATGRFDDEHLFYLQARGITRARGAAPRRARLPQRGRAEDRRARLEARLQAALEAELEASR